MKHPTKNQIKHDWHLIDVRGETLGRISTKIAGFLMGKSKSYFVANLDCGDYVVVVNAKEVKVSGNKEKNKKYRRHSGYPGGFREETLGELRARKPTEIIKHAVSGMLPDNKLKDIMLGRLFIFGDEKHDYDEKFSAKPQKLIASS